MSALLLPTRWLVVVHPVHLAAGWHSGRSLLLGLFGDHRFSRDQQPRHRSGVLHGQPHHLGRIDDAGPDHVYIFASLRIEGVVEIVRVERLPTTTDPSVPAFSATCRTGGCPK